VAALGYVALAADLYGEGKSTDESQGSRRPGPEKVRHNTKEWEARASARAPDLARTSPG